MATERFDGKVEVRDSSGANVRIALNGDTGNITAGRGDADGDLVLQDGDGRARIRLDAGGGNIWVGGNDADGDIVIFPKDATNRENVAEATIHLDGDAGDIKLMGADCAEYFAVSEASRVDPGTVLVAGQDKSLGECTDAYDKRVVGVVSGAGELQPGIVLNKKVKKESSAPVALVGTVFCKVDARYGAVEVGDLLTTSATPGHAMKAIEPDRAFGAVLGKALGPLDTGRELIPVLVTLR